MNRRLVLLLGLLAGLPAGAMAAPLYLIYDSSNSMWGVLESGERKYEAARTAIQALLAETPSERPLALRVYGAQDPADCRDSQLRVPFGKDNRAQIEQIVGGVRPTGQTPIAFSLERALVDLQGGPGDILLITDGIESCDADPCALLDAWRRNDVNVAVHIVGLGLEQRELEALRCLSDTTANGVVDAQSLAQLTDSVVQIARDTASPGLMFFLRAPDENLPQLVGDGVLSGPLDTASAESSLPVQSNRRYLVAPGRFNLRVGVRTVSGEVFEAQETEIVVAGETQVAVDAPLPPILTVALWQHGAAVAAPIKIGIWRDQIRQALITQGESVFVMPGTYELRFTPPGMGQQIERIDVAAGDRRAVRVNLAATTRVTINWQSAERGIALRHNTPLFVDGVEVARVHQVNGATLEAGTYTARLDDKLATYETTFHLTGEKREQAMRFDVPMGYVQVTYEDADGRQESPARRVFVRRDERSRTERSDAVFALLPGEYDIVGWPRGYETRRIQVHAGQTVQVRLGKAN